ncbi:hypothetical protein LN042_30465 [Kitasatospora sp. RB6PN24]|uniref:DUF6924 domain-containing protein n=1 Tax=Kitasatospora humi TaxID=2893891 RepID=UPI001E3E789B|nr:hypothetical protein [Kitasatospora humi]MCC9311335.1 hypothetical protein [Kitasatospora humi]
MTLLIRTDFADQAGWDALCTAVRTASDEGSVADVALVEEPGYAGLSTEQVIPLLPEDVAQRLVVLADEVTFSSHELPVLLVDLLEQRSIRVVASELQSVETELSLANLEFDDVARGVEEDGVFRGFSGF